MAPWHTTCRLNTETSLVLVDVEMAPYQNSAPFIQTKANRKTLLVLDLFPVSTQLETASCLHTSSADIVFYIFDINIPQPRSMMNM